MNLFEKLETIKLRFLDELDEIQKKEFSFDPNLSIDEYIDIVKDMDFDIEDLKDLIDRKIDAIRKKAYKKAAKKDFQSNVIVTFEEDFRLIIIRDYVNSLIQKNNAIIKEETRPVRNKIRNIDKIVSMLNEPYKNIKKESVFYRLKDLNLEESEYKEFDKLINDYLEEKNNKELELSKKLNSLIEEKKKAEIKEDEIIVQDEPHDKLSINNIDKIEDVIDKYDNLLPFFLNTDSIKNVFNYNEIKQVIDLNYNELDSEMYYNAFISILYLIDKSSNDVEVLNFKKDLIILSKKYERALKLKDLSNNIKLIWKTKTVDDFLAKKLFDIQDSVEKYINSNINDDSIDSFIENIKINIYKEFNNIDNIESIKGKNFIKSFILFDSQVNEDGELVPYIISDLDSNNRRNLIDDSIDKNKLFTNGYIDFNELINDLMIYGKPSTVIDNNEYISKLIRPVYKRFSKYDPVTTNHDNTTGMIRMRPNISSYVRFIDEKIVLLPNTRKFIQVKELLENKFDNLEIDSNKPFNLYINVLTSFKKKDDSIYITCINRQNKSYFRDFTDSFSKIDEFNDEQLEFLDEMIELSIKTFNDLKNINSNFDFEVIKKITDKRTY